MEKKTAIVVGAGGAGRNFHIPAYRAHPGIGRVIVCDTSEAALNACRGMGFADGDLFTDLKEALRQKPFLGSVCVPNHLHKEASITLLNADVHVLCEKPPAMNAAEVQEMKAAVSRARVRLHLHFNNRFRPEIRWLLEASNGNLGFINTAQVQWVRRNGIPGWGSAFTQKHLAGGGPIIDLLLHMLDIALYAMEYPEPKFVTATANDCFGQDKDAQGPWCPANPGGKFDVETASQGTIILKGGRSIQFRASWAERIHREVVECALQGKEAGASIRRTFGHDGDDSTAEDECVIVRQSNGQPSDVVYRGSRDPMMGRLAAVQAFATSVISGEQDILLGTPNQALKLMRIIDAIYTSAAEEGKPVEF